MRAIALIGSITILTALPAAAQSSANPSRPYGLDPYKPSDAAILRNYGSVLVAETPLLELGGLDPYNPTEAALLRQLGNGVPQCCIVVGGTPMFGPLMLTSARGDRPQPAPQVVVMAPPPAMAETSPSAPATVSGPVATAIRPQVNDGVSIRYNGGTWISAGRAVVFQPSDFERLGEYASVPVYQRLRSTDGLIYVRAREGMVAPYRQKP